MLMPCNKGKQSKVTQTSGNCNCKTKKIKFCTLRYTKFTLLYHQGTKRKRDHCGILQNYSWEKESCLTLISSMKSTEKINFMELAQKVNLKNKKGKRNIKILTSQQ